jgi:hypothetical protein
MRSIVGLGVVVGIAVLATALLASASAQTTSQPAVQPTPGPGGITMIRPPMEFPAIGNIDAVREWKLGRVERLERRAGSDDVLVEIRTADNQVHQVIAPREPVGFLVRQCGWLSTPTQTFASRSDYAERMIAFDVDANGRLIAIMSLEPFGRSSARMRQAFCN